MTPIFGETASAIADSVRDLVSRGDLPPGCVLPPIRALAAELQVNRNTVAAAYRQLVAAGVAHADGRRGTVIAALPDLTSEQLPAPNLVDFASGNPDPRLLPDLREAIARAQYEPAMYGAPAVDPRLLEVARAIFAPDIGTQADIVVTHGAVDAVERVLNSHLARGDGVAVEDPCFLASIGTVRLNGYRRIPAPVDEHGMTPDGLRHAIVDHGARAVVITPRAHNPTGATISEERAGELRAVLTEFPEVLVVEDDYFSLASTHPYRRVTPASTNNWALVRSLSKFLGPDLRLALVAGNPQTVQILGARLRPGKTWVSLLLQAAAAYLLTDATTLELVTHAGREYAKRSRILVDALAAQSISPVGTPDGLNMWIALPDPAAVEATVLRLSYAGWAVQSGQVFAAVTDSPRCGIRITAATIDETLAADFAAQLAAVLVAVGA